MNPIRTLLPLAALVLLPLKLSANPPGPGGSLAGAMEVAVWGGEIRVTLTFHNRSPKVVWLEKLEEGQAPMRPEFEIRTDDGRLVPYIGPTAKRPVYAKEDFFPLEPGRTSKRELRIDDRYDFPEGRKDYRATFSYPCWNDKTREAVFRALKSVKFTYSR